jgi:hypothetical protein
MRTLYYHAGAGAAAAARRLGVQSLEYSLRRMRGALAPCSAPASRTPALADFVFPRFNFTSTLLQL